jgi:hypothetical protein
MSMASGISNMIQQKQSGTLTTANKIGNITDIVGGALGIASPVVGAIGSEVATAAGKGVMGVGEIIGSQAASNVARLTNIAKGVDIAKKVIGGAEVGNFIVNNAATLPNTISQAVRGKDFYDNNMNGDF